MNLSWWIPMELSCSGRNTGNLSGKQADVSNSLFQQSCMWEKFRGLKDSMDHLLQLPINAGPKKVKMAFR